jgi:hypothetical protein
MLITSLITIIILLVCVVLLSVNILFRKDGKFPDTHIEGNQALRKRGIHCASMQDYEHFTQKNLEKRLIDNN